MLGKFLIFLVAIGIFYWFYSGGYNSAIETLTKPTTSINPKAEAFPSQEVQEQAKVPKTTKPFLDLRQLERDIHELVNLEREKQGLSPLEFDENLANIARMHSEDMVSRNYFSHDSPAGCDPSCRYRENNYFCNSGIESAENLFQNNLYDSITYYSGIPDYDWNSQDEIAKSTVEGWMGSSGHRQNILMSSLTKEGIGIAISNDDKVYITQNFC